MIAEFMGGYMDGTRSDFPLEWGDTIKFPHRKIDETARPKIDSLVYRREPGTIKFYFDKIEEV